MILQYYVAVVAKKNTMVEVSFIAIIYTKKLLTKRYKNLKKKPPNGMMTTLWLVASETIFSTSLWQAASTQHKHYKKHFTSYQKV